MLTGNGHQLFWSHQPKIKCSVTFWGEKAPHINNIGMFTSCTIYFNCIQITKKNGNK